MTRVLSLVTLILSFLAASLAAEAQPQPKIPRIGVVAGGFPKDDACVEALRRGIHELGYVEGQMHVLELRWSEGRVEPFPFQVLRDLGYVEGQNVVIEGRWYGDRPERLPALAAGILLYRAQRGHTNGHIG
jgi:hypothetical protein